MIALAVFALTASAQTNFNEGKKFQEILEQAAQEGKPVFIDCFTSWCGPCKMMARDVFPLKEAGDYFNAKFVCWSIDMEKGEGPGLAEKYDVSAYPTFLVLNNDGTLKGRHVGSAPVDKFIASIDRILNEEKGLPWYQRQFKEGQRDEAFMREYMQLLDQNYMRSEKKQVVEALLSGKTANEIVTDSSLFKTFRSADFTPDDELFLQVYRLRADVLSHQGEQTVAALNKQWKQGARMCMKFDGKEYLGFDEEKFQAYKQKMNEYGVPNVEQIEDGIRVVCANYAKDYATLAKYLEKDIRTGGAVWIDSRDMLPVLDGFANHFAEDKEMSQLAVRAARLRVKLLQESNATGNSSYVLVGGVRKTAAEFLTERYQELINRIEGQ